MCGSPICPDSSEVEPSTAEPSITAKRMYAISAFTRFTKKEPLERHIPNCQPHPSQEVRYPDPEQTKEYVAEFRNKAAQFRLPFLSSLRFRILLDSHPRKRRRRRGQGDSSDRRAPRVRLCMLQSDWLSTVPDRPVRVQWT